MGRERLIRDEFVDEVLAGCLNARLVAVGEDFHFGRHREGNVALLREIGTPDEPHQVACHYAEEVTGEEWHRLNEEKMREMGEVV